MNKPRICIIIPVLNDATELAQTLASVNQCLEPLPVMVVDGGSDDDSQAVTQRHACSLIVSEPGRARQMNAGAQTINTQADYFLFLHADTRLPDDASQQLAAAAKRGAIWGRFDVRIKGQSAMLPVVARLMNWRSQLTGIATGDQAIFVKREVFEAVGRFAEQPLMEDIELSKRLRQVAWPTCLRGPVITSGRRWDERGVWHTITLMWRLRWRYWRGVRAEQLARDYQ
jgi:rSAM/selenodomain-associated transferase 2